MFKLISVSALMTAMPVLYRMRRKDLLVCKGQAPSWQGRQRGQASPSQPGSPHALQWDCGRDGSRSPAAGAHTLPWDRQAPGEMGSPFSKRKPDFCRISFQFAKVKGVEGMVCKSHRDCKGKGALPVEIKRLCVAGAGTICRKAGE